MGMKGKILIELDETIPEMTPNTYYDKTVAPGTHLVKIYSMSNNGRSLDYTVLHEKEVTVDKGSTVFVRVRSESSWNAPFNAFSIDLVGKKEATRDLGSCYRSSTILYGMINDPPFVGKKKTTHATIHLYRKPVTLYTAAIGPYDIGIYANGGNKTRSLLLDSCQVFSLSVKPGTVKFRQGIFALTGLGQAILSTGSAAMGYRSPQLLSAQAMALESRLSRTNPSWGFKAEAGRDYYVEFIVPEGMFRFTQPGDIPEKCLKNKPKVTEHRDIDFIRKAQDDDLPVGLLFLVQKGLEKPQIYSSIEPTGGVLDYLTAELVSSGERSEIANEFSKIDVATNIRSHLINRLRDRLTGNRIRVNWAPDTPVAKEDSLLKAAQENGVRYLFIFKVYIYGLTYQARALFPVHYSGGRDKMVVALKMYTIDCATKNIVQTKPYFSWLALSTDGQEPGAAGYSRTFDKITEHIAQEVAADLSLQP